MCPGCGIIYRMDTDCSNSQSNSQRIIRYKIFISFLINLTTLNDQIIDKYLFFILIWSKSVLNHTLPWFPYCFDCFMQQTDKGTESKCGTTKGKAITLLS